MDVVQTVTARQHVTSRTSSRTGPSPTPAQSPCFSSLLDALPDATAVVASDGTIIAVNRAWRMFALDNGGRPETTGVGVNYIDVCLRAIANGSPDARAALAALRQV